MSYLNKEEKPYISAEINKDLDTDFDEVQVYALFYNNLNVPPQVTEVVKKSIPNSGVVNFKHTTLLDVIADGLEKILIPSNTWDVCKDIAIKDNICIDSVDHDHV